MPYTLHSVRPPMPELVAVLDVVVHQRIVVKELNGDRSVQRMLERRALGLARRA